MNFRLNDHRIALWRDLLSRTPIIGFFSLALLLTPVIARGAEATETAPSETSDRVGPIKLHEVPIDQILELLERWTGKSILRPQTLPVTNFTLNLKEQVTKTQAIRAIETLLSLNGVGVSALDENFLKITPLAATKVEAPELITGSTLDLPPSGRTASKLFRPKYLRVNDFMPQLAGLLNPAAGGPPAVFDKANAALITDSITNLQRVENLLIQIDRPETSRLQPKFYPLKFVKAGELSAKLHGMFSGPLQNDLGSASFTADERTNQIVLFADPQQHALFDELMGRLDVKSGQDTRNDIIHLKHAAAKEVSGILSQLITGQTTISKNGPDSGRAGSTAKTGSVATDAATTSETLGAALKMELSTQFSNLVTVLPEERSNSIVVSGTVDDIRLINELVSKIDVLLAQVRIEVVIAEVSLEDNHTSGIAALGLQVSGDKLIGFSGSLPGLSVSNGTITRGDASTKPPVIVSGPWDLAAQISLAATPRKNHTNILSVPNIITTHNREGKIFVGEERPMISSYLNDGGAGIGGNTGAGAGYRSTVNSKDIGIQLSVKPLIGTDGSVQLEIRQEVSDILGDIIIDGNPQPRIGRRSTESFVSAKTGETIVLGGLQRSSLSKSTSRLGPIAFLGDLFGSRTKNQSRTDLIFFLRPTVLTATPADNISALKQIEQLPKADRREIEKLLAPPTPPSS